MDLKDLKDLKDPNDLKDLKDPKKNIIIMSKIYFNTRDELVCIDTTKIAAVQANGNYSKVLYISNRELTINSSLSNMEQTLKSQGGKSSRFIRLGRSFIINHAFLQRIDILKQQLVLSDGERNELVIKLPKNILKSYKNAVAQSIKIKANS